ncbi:hypothetical protein EJ02DRAFT_421109 [Clathrospora elynae]|uniref:Uncharacterized protein n=1 Tax=Clathrospora elynae TaxID=706981 RepID=A0A6A5ST59_9PLEO|nr:hypothetical protein EJ02DRAFT_421109 [Clathrospora elynae]
MANEVSSSSHGCCELTREELMRDTNLKERDWRFINPELWDADFEAPDDEVDAIAATTYIARAIADYTDQPTADEWPFPVNEELFGEFYQDFKGWNEVMFRRAHEKYTKELKRILCFKGVYTGRANMTPVEAVVGVLNSEECPQWPDELFQNAVFDKRSSAYMLQQRRSGPESSTCNGKKSSICNGARTTDHKPAHGYHRTQPDQQRQPPSTYNNFDRFREYTPAYPQRPKGPSLRPMETSGKTDPYKAVPPIDFSNEKLDATTINAFVKMWDRDKKYTGKPYDLLDDKLKIFYNTTSRKAALKSSPA